MKEDFLLVIPARLESTRLPKKLLIDIEGKSIIERTYKQALKSIKDKEKIIIATDSLEIKDHCENFGSRTFTLTKNGSRYYTINTSARISSHSPSLCLCRGIGWIGVSGSG